MARVIHSLADWSDEEIDHLLGRAAEFVDGARPHQVPGAVVGMCLFQTSLRTRVGFESAAHRVGAGFVEATERRSSADSMPERLEDTIRVMSGYSDALIVRSTRVSAELQAAALAGRPWLNAGDATEHPTQALIDLFAIEQLAGPLAGVRLAIMGDLRMRAAGSLLDLLQRRPPSALAVASAPELLGKRVPSDALAVSDVSSLIAFAPDVIYQVGIPHQAVSEDVRSRLRLNRETLSTLDPATIVLSPLPLIDEIASNARADARIRWFEQSDLGLHVRTAILESLLRGLG